MTVVTLQGSIIFFANAHVTLHDSLKFISNVHVTLHDSINILRKGIFIHLSLSKNILLRNILPGV